MIKHSHYLILLILIVTVISYSNTLHGEFQFDDDTFIAENQGIKDPFLLFGTNPANLLSSGSRPLTMLTFSLNYRIGGLNVEGYHIVNILIHLLSTVLIYLLFMRILSPQPFRDSLGNRPDIIACVVAGIFALHPIQTQAVTYIIQRAEVLASLFYLLSVFSFVRFIEAGGKKSLLFWLMGAFSFLAGWWSKQVIITAPATLILYVVFFREKKHLKKTVLGISPLILAGIFLGIREVMSFQGSRHVGFDILGLGPQEYFFTEMRVLLTYVRLLFFPVDQNLDYDYPVYRDFFDANVIGSVLFWLLMAIASLYSLRIQGRWQYHFRGMGFGVLWFLTILLPTSSVIPLADVIYEHRVYLAMAGIAFSAVLGADMALIALKRYLPGNAQKLILIPFIIVFLLLPTATYGRNKVWLTKSSLWLDVVKKSPMKSRPHNNLGNCYYLRGDYPSALRHYLTAINLDPENAEAYYNTAISLEKVDRRSDAVFYYLRFMEKFSESYKPLAKDIEQKLRDKNMGGTSNERIIH